MLKDFEDDFVVEIETKIEGLVFNVEPFLLYSVKQGELNDDLLY